MRRRAFLQAAAAGALLPVVAQAEYWSFAKQLFEPNLLVPKRPPIGPVEYIDGIKGSIFTASMGRWSDGTVHSSGTMTRANFMGMPSYYGSASTDHLSYTTGELINLINNSTSLTFILHFATTSTATTQFVIWSGTDSQESNGWGVGNESDQELHIGRGWLDIGASGCGTSYTPGSNGSHFYLSSREGPVTQDSSVTFAINTPSVIVASSQFSGEEAINFVAACDYGATFVAATESDTCGYVTNRTTHDLFKIGNSDADLSRGFIGHVFSVQVLDHYLPPQACATLARDPYLLLKPQVPPEMWMKAAAAVGTPLPAIMADQFIIE